MDKWLEKALHDTVIEVASISILHRHNGVVRIVVRDEHGELLVDKALSRGEGYRLRLEKVK